jgi:hypothetical protein
VAIRGINLLPEARVVIERWCPSLAEAVVTDDDNHDNEMADEKVAA